jgi:hypothetical protein
MSQIDAEAQVSSQDTEIDDQADVGSGKFVPVNRAIHYRRRAQAAEQKVHELSEQLNAVRCEAQELVRKMNQLQTEQVLTHKLVVAGASDLETALLVAKARASFDGADPDGIVEELISEKPHLFGSTAGGRGSTRANDAGAVENTSGAAPKTAAVKDRRASGRSSLEKAAAKAASTGSRVDLQEYLRLRRNFV